MSIWSQIAIACPLVFIAGFIDSIAGGGGLISLPAYHMAGLSPHMALGTNKFSSCVGTTTSTHQYIRHGFVEPRLILISVICALTGSYIGARCALFLSERVLQIVMMVLVPLIAVATAVKKDFLKPADEPLEGAKAQLITAASALVIGWYDGFFGPGTGMFLMLAFVGLVKLDVITACGNTKVVNLSSNVAALTAFIAAGEVYYLLAIPCAVCSVAGNILGARLAMKRGLKIIKPVMLVVVGLLLLKVGSDFFSAAVTAMES